MVYLLSSLFLFIAAAFVLGLAVGWVTCKHEPRKEGLGWFWFGLSAFVFGLFVSGTKWIKGSAGLWFDTAMWLFGAYILGCLIGCALSQWLRPAPLSAAALSAVDKLTLLPDTAAAVCGAAKPVAASLAGAASVAVAGAAAGPAAVRPYQWQAARDGSRVTLTGYVPSEDARGRVVSAARAAFANAEVTDALQLGGGAPDGLEGMATAALGHLAHVSKGIASLIDAKYTLTGVAGSQGDHDVIAAAVKALPSGYSLAKADIVAAPAVAPKADKSSKPASAAVATKPVAAAPTPAPAKPLPAAAPKVAGEEKVPGKRPAGYVSAIDGNADDLKRIRGIGKQNEARLHGLGIWHFGQIASWSAEECLWIGSYLAFPGRIEREEWVKQAKVLATGSETEFSRRVDDGQVETSQSNGPAATSTAEPVKPMRPVKGTPPKDVK